MTLGVCVLAVPEIVVGAVVVAGVVVVGFAIKEALDTYAEKRGRPQVVKPAPETRPVPETAPAPPKCYRARWMREKRARMSALGDGEGSSGQGKPITETGKARQVG
jgi:hypothetical protein